MDKITTKFQPGNQHGKNNLGKKHKKTIMRERIGIDNIEQLAPAVIEIWIELLESNIKDDRKFASKEISKYIFSVKKEVTHNETPFEDFLAQISRQREAEKKLKEATFLQVKENEITPLRNPEDQWL